MDKPQIIAHIQKSLNFTANDCKWIPTSAKFVVLGNHPRGSGALQVYEISHADVKLVHQAEKSKGFQCGTFGASSGSERHLATGGFDGKLNIWDLERTELPIYSVSAHNGLIYCIDGVGGLGIGEGAPEIVTSGQDGDVKVWDPRQKEPVASMESNEAKRECWAVAFGNSYNAHDRCVCAGYDNGDLKMFDLRKMSLQWEHNVKNGVCGIEFDRKDIAMNKLVATCLESKVHVFDMRTQHPTKGFASLSEKAHGGSTTIWKAKHLPQNRDVFMTTGGNGSLNLWKYSYPNKRVTEHTADKQLMGVAGTVQELQNVTLSTMPIRAFDWSPDKMGLAVCTASDETLRVLICTKLNTL